MPSGKSRSSLPGSWADCSVEFLDKILNRAKADWIFGIGPEKLGVKAFDPSGRRACDSIPGLELTLA